MKCDVCGYEYTMREIQDDAPCPRCEEKRQNGSRATSATAGAARTTVSPVVSKAVRGLEGAQPVVVVDFQMSFNSMVWFMVKAAIAAIPAMIIITILWLIVVALFGGIFAGIGSIPAPIK